MRARGLNVIYLRMGETGAAIRLWVESKLLHWLAKYISVALLLALIEQFEFKSMPLIWGVWH
jgi:hypothetical protein